MEEGVGVWGMGGVERGREGTRGEVVCGGLTGTHAAHIGLACVWVCCVVIEVQKVTHTCRWGQESGAVSNSC